MKHQTKLVDRIQKLISESHHQNLGDQYERTREAEELVDLFSSVTPKRQVPPASVFAGLTPIYSNNDND